MKTLCFLMWLGIIVAKLLINKYKDKENLADFLLVSDVIANVLIVIAVLFTLLTGAMVMQRANKRAEIYPEYKENIKTVLEFYTPTVKGFSVEKSGTVNIEFDKNEWESMGALKHAELKDKLANVVDTIATNSTYKKSYEDVWIYFYVDGKQIDSERR